MKKAKPNGPDIFAPDKVAWLEQARAAARRLLKSREYVTIEDVTKECPLPRHLNHNLIGSVFRQPEVFQMVGLTPARRPNSNGRWIFKWALKNPPVPEKWVSRAEQEDTR